LVKESFFINLAAGTSPVILMALAAGRLMSDLVAVTLDLTAVVSRVKLVAALLKSVLVTFEEIFDDLTAGTSPSRVKLTVAASRFSLASTESMVRFNLPGL